MKKHPKHATHAKSEYQRAAKKLFHGKRTVRHTTHKHTAHMHAKHHTSKHLTRHKTRTRHHKSVHIRSRSRHRSKA